MAKFCGNCGTQLEDNAKVCGNCGAPLDGISPDISGLNSVDPEKQKKVRNIVKGVLTGAAVVIAAVIVLNIVSQFTGYKGLLRKVMSAYKNYDIETLVSLSGDMYYYGNEDWVEKYFEYAVGDDLDSFESVGHNYKLSYEVNEIYIMSDRKFDEVISQIELAYSDFDTSTIDKIAVADLTVTAKQGKESTSQDIDIIMSKENGKWRLLYIN